VPVIINEIEVLEQPTPRPAPDRAAPPAPAAPAMTADGIRRLLKRIDGHQRRLVAD
jgi:hypothetical protein